MAPASPGPAPYRILVVCTANICRSVMAERFLRRDAEGRGLSQVEVGSCGVLFDDQPASDTVISVLAERGLDVSDHRSRTFAPVMLDSIHLVVTMTRAHARDLTLAVDGASPRIHTLGALVAWLGEPEHRVGSAAERVARFADARGASALLGSGDDEIADPHGRSKRVHRKAADRIEEFCAGLLDGLFGATDSD